MSEREMNIIKYLCFISQLQETSALIDSCRKTSMSAFRALKARLLDGCAVFAKQADVLK